MTRELGTTDRMIAARIDRDDASRPRPAREDPDASRAAAGGRPRVLLLDDNATLVHCLADVLSVAGYDAMPVTRPHAAVELASRVSVDALIVDLEMPEMDGVLALQALRTVAPCALRFLMTGCIDEGRVAELAPSVQRVLRKPFGPDELLHVLRDAGLHPSRRGPSTRRA